MEWLAGADDLGVPILGICFGAQALAAGLGGGARRLTRPANGWVELVVDDPALVPPGPWLAVHEDCVVLPPGARELARDESGTQAFAVGGHLGVLFHPEATPSILRRWAADKPGALSRDLLVRASERCSIAAVGALTLFDAFLRHSGADQAAGVTAEAR